MSALTAALHERDDYTHYHSDRVVAISTELGIACELSERELPLLRVAAQFHDIGKIGVPDHVLLKPGKLSDDEWVIMKAHAEQGERIFRATKHPLAEKIAPFIRHHHEAFDGNGYPDGLKGEAIPLLSRILAVADSYDAMSTTRPYRTAMPHHQVMAIMESEQGRKFDPLIFRAFMQVIERISACQS